jgi:hypothetical protein
VEKLEGKYIFEQAIGIAKFIDKAGCFRFGYYNDNPAILIGYEDTKGVPEEFIRINMLEMLNKRLEIYSKNGFSDSVKDLEDRLNKLRNILYEHAFDNIRVKRVDLISNKEVNTSNYYDSISNGEDVFGIYMTPKIHDNEEQGYNQSAKLASLGRTLCKVRGYGPH